MGLGIAWKDPFERTRESLCWCWGLSPSSGDHDAAIGVVAPLSGILTPQSGTLALLLGISAPLLGIITLLSGIIAPLLGIITLLSGIIAPLLGTFWTMSLRDGDYQFGAEVDPAT